MAFNGLVLLLACCLSVPSFARNLDVSHTGFLQSKKEARSAGLLVSKKQAPISSSAETGHAKGASISSVLYHETWREADLLHETGHDEDPKPELSFDGILLHDSQLVLPDDDTIPSFLAQNGLPIGLLPSSVASYSITDDGDFAISLQKACYAKFDYEVYYAQTVTGKLSYGTITDLSGIQAKQAFFWVSVTGIHTDNPSSEFIYFDAGPITKKLSISQFQTIPVCKAKDMTSRLLADWKINELDI